MIICQTGFGLYLCNLRIFQGGLASLDLFSIGSMHGVFSQLYEFSEAVEGRLGDTFGSLSETLLEPLGSLMEPLGASWELLGQPNRFLNDLDAILTSRMRSIWSKNHQDLLKLTKKSIKNFNCFRHRFLTALGSLLR